MQQVLMRVLTKCILCSVLGSVWDATVLLNSLLSFCSVNEALEQIVGHPTLSVTEPTPVSMAEIGSTV